MPRIRVAACALAAAVLTGCSSHDPDPGASSSPATAASTTPVLTTQAAADLYRGYLVPELLATLDFGKATIATPRVLADCTRAAAALAEANRTFSAALTGQQWPAAAQEHVDELVRILAADAGPLGTMATASTQAAFDQALTAYFAGSLHRGATLAQIRRDLGLD